MTDASNNLGADADKVWVCRACGKTSPDKYGLSPGAAKGWDASCMLNSILCYLQRNTDGKWIAVDPQPS